MRKSHMLHWICFDLSSSKETYNLTAFSQNFTLSSSPYSLEKHFNLPNNRMISTHNRFLSLTSYIETNNHLHIEKHQFLKLQTRNRKWIPFQEPQDSSKNKNFNLKPLSSRKNNSNYHITSSAQRLSIQPSTLEISPYHAVKLLKAFASQNYFNPKLDNSVLLNLELRVDLTRDSIRGSCELPFTIGRNLKLLAFCPDEMAPELIASGADFAGITSPLEKISAGKIDFDRCIATPEIMPLVMKVARILGPLKLMPNPKSGTIVNNLKESILSSKSGNLLEYRAQGQGKLAVTIGTINLKESEILENIRFFITELLKHKPKTSSTDDTSQNNLTGLIWPPNRNISKYPRTSKNSSLGGNTYNMIKSSYLKLKSSPQIDIQPDLLSPQSLGYYR